MSHHSIAVCPDDIKKISSLVERMKSETEQPTEENIFPMAAVYAQELPRAVRLLVHDFTTRESCDALTLKMGDAFCASAGNTPTEYDELEPGYVYNDAQIVHALISTLIGIPVGYSSQRSGRRLNNIIPTKNLENVPNSSSGSKYDFGFHTEDAFHEFKGDHLGLVCIRNDERASTNFVSINEIKISPLLKAALFKPDYVIGHNPIHQLPEGHKPPRNSILYGCWDRPFMRINVNNTYGVDRSAQYALDDFILAMNAASEQVVLEKGDFFYLDNLYTAHARDAYSPHWGPNARWLSRFILTKDIRKSAVARKDWRSPVIENDYDQNDSPFGSR